MKKVCLIESAKRCGKANIFSVSIFAGKNSDGKLLYKISSGEADDIMADALAWCSKKRLGVIKIRFADGKVFETKSPANVISRSSDGWIYCKKPSEVC